MADWQGDYCTLEQLKLQVRVADDVDDDAFEAAITAASRAIDHECGRQFGVYASAVGRTYTLPCDYWIDGQSAVPIDDLSSATDLVVTLDEDDTGGYATTLTIYDDFTPWPYNALADGRPWTHLLMLGRSSYSWPRYPNAISVEGKWGWAAVPAVVTQACLIQAARFFVRRDASFGIAGSPELGNELRLLDRLDPDVAVLLSGVKRHWGAV